MTKELKENYSKLEEENKELRQKIITSERFRAEDARDGQGDYMFIYEQIQKVKSENESLKGKVKEEKENAFECGFNYSEHLRTGGFLTSKQYKENCQWWNRSK